MAERNRFKYMRFNKEGRTSQLDEENVTFARNDESSPRQIVYKNECPKEFENFKNCMTEHDNRLSECAHQNSDLEHCGKKAFSLINAMTESYDYHKGLHRKDENS
ncbi:unnamed protein product [Blepharisma stoltei]|uniref:IMS import disulfide relay-system CHCH-CHCH-like Cx9C domain-containing protein n=1 Tax=Blepharisma stoltei TaxID=1481888 RepID=A0AAU9IUW7_9CILI|nr:unnamed protein product [Blepharisma stoltei]